jgi:hypothetical protein
MLAIGLSVCLATVGLSAICSAPAMAADTVQVAIGAGAPEQAIPVQITYSGTFDTQGRVSSVVRPAGGLGCQATFNSDNTANGNNSNDIELTDSSRTAAFSFSETYSPPNPGTYLVCTWSEDSSNNTVAGPISTNFTAQGPQVSALTVALSPGTPAPNVPYQIVFTTQTDQQLELDSIVKPAGGLPCAATFNLESEQDGNVGTELFDGHQVYGGPVASTASDTEPAGSYLICTWVEGPNSNEVDAALSTPFSIPAPVKKPPPAPKPAAAKLRITHSTASHKHGATITGTTASALSGRIVVYATCGKASTSTTPRDRNGRFSGHIKLPKTCQKAGRVKLGAVWAGSAAFKKQAVSESVLIKK